MNYFTLGSGQLSLEALESIAHNQLQLNLSARAYRKIIESRALVEQAVAEQRVIYGVTTGFGQFCNVNIPTEQALQLQENLILSHSAGVGTPFDIATARAIMAARANSLAQGYSGVRPEIFELIFAMLELNIIPVIPVRVPWGLPGIWHHCHISLWH